MAGHSKWANIKHRKAAQDARRGKVFTKLIRELVVAAKQGGPLPEDNPRLRAAVDKALGGLISEAIAAGDLRGKKGEVALFYSRGAVPARRVLVVGLGPLDDFSPDAVRWAAASAAVRSIRPGSG